MNPLVQAWKAQAELTESMRGLECLYRKACSLSRINKRVKKKIKRCILSERDRRRAKGFVALGESMAKHIREVMEKQSIMRRFMPVQQVPDAYFEDNKTNDTG